jgi:hypothetical protein
VCMGLDRAPGHGLKLHLSGCIGGIFDRRPLGFFLAEALRNSFPSFLVAHSHQNQLCAHALGNYVDYHCNGVLELHLVLRFSSAARACGNVGPQTC